MNSFPMHSHDDLVLAGYHSSAVGTNSPDALLILLHGIAEHCGRYKNFVDFYNRHKFAIITMDLRGHGKSQGLSSYIPTSDDIFKDIDLLIKKGKELYPSCPAVLYGHSMGGALVLSYTLDRYSNPVNICPYQALIAASPWIRLARPFQPPAPIYSLIRNVCRMKPHAHVPLRVNINKITRDEEVRDDYNKDDLIRRSTTLALAGSMGNMAVTLDRTSAIFRIPVLLQHGEADSITSCRASSKFCKRGTNIEFKEWPHCYHELHNEPEREDIFHFTYNWLKRKLFVS